MTTTHITDIELRYELPSAPASISSPQPMQAACCLGFYQCVTLPGCILAGTLLARGLLDVSDHAHKAMLDAELGVPAPASGVKRERADGGGDGERVKRERGGGAGQGGVVDLTREPVDPLLEVRPFARHPSFPGPRTSAWQHGWRQGKAEGRARGGWGMRSAVLQVLCVPRLASCCCGRRGVALQVKRDRCARAQTCRRGERLARSAVHASFCSLARRGKRMRTMEMRPVRPRTRADRRRRKHAAPSALCACGLRHYCLSVAGGRRSVVT